MCVLCHLYRLAVYRLCSYQFAQIPRPLRPIDAPTTFQPDHDHHSLSRASRHAHRSADAVAAAVPRLQVGFEPDSSSATTTQTDEHLSARPVEGPTAAISPRSDSGATVSPKRRPTAGPSPHLAGVRTDAYVSMGRRPQTSGVATTTHPLFSPRAVAGAHIPPSRSSPRAVDILPSTLVVARSAMLFARDGERGERR